MERSLWYSSPAKNWNEALPVGNGSLGAMQYGGVAQDKLCLNHDTLWSGNPKDFAPEEQDGWYRECRRLAFERRYAEAQALLEAHLCGPFGESYMPLGDLLLNFEGLGETSGYRRTLDLENALSLVSFAGDGVNYERQCLISFPDDCLALRLTADKKGALNFTLTLDSKLKNTVRVENNLVVCQGECPTHAEPNYVQSDDPLLYENGKHGVGFCCAAGVVTNGSVQAIDDALRVTGADEVLILLTVRTNFVDYKTLPFDPEMKHVSGCISHLEDCLRQSWASLLERHIKDYQSLEQRCTLQIGADACDMPTHERLRNLPQNPGDGPALAELLFRYGRYLMISSSRPGTQPSNLQGIWNDQLRAPWSSNYTVNINTEMNYWPVFMGNLAMCALPLVGMINDLTDTGGRVARNVYGSKGFVTHHNVDLWRMASPVGDHREGSAVYGFWPMGSAWLCRTVYEYYEFTQDMDYLRGTAYPLLKEAAAFYEPLLIPDEGGALILCPATSPENSFIWEGKTVSVSRSSTMTQSLLHDLFLNCAASAEALGDGTEALRLRELANQLARPVVGSDGRMLEWADEVEEPELHHRHISHLYGLHPGQEIDTHATPKLADACKKSLEARGDEGTGWSLAWKINQWARLGEGDHAFKLIIDQLRLVTPTPNILYAGGGGSYANLMCAHPPFQIDGNFGAASGILEMLVQSTAEEIRVLPALPSNWPNGSLKGVCARGGYTLDLEWNSRKLTALTVHAVKDGCCHLRYQGQTVELAVKANQSTAWKV